MESTNYVVSGIAMYAEAMINCHHANQELVWLRLRQECDYRLRILADQEDSE
jgi:hypothetical protein